MKMKHKFGSRKGQTMVEYIIIVVVIAIAALAIFGLFGDTIKKKMGGAVSSLDANPDQSVESLTSTSAAEQLRNLDTSGTTTP